MLMRPSLVNSWPFRRSGRQHAVEEVDAARDRLDEVRGVPVPIR
jgi:hypothetical protein